MVEQRIVSSAIVADKGKSGTLFGRSMPERLDEVSADPTMRLSLRMVEFSRVLGGGVVPGSLILVAGDPGIGKSTLLLEVAAQIASEHGKCLYISGEESVPQIKMRADRMHVNAQELYLVTETNLDVMIQHIEEIKPVTVVVDSIQTTYTNDLSSSAGSISQVRECASRLQELAKRSGLAVILVGHVTKEGTIAGPRVLEHIVDTVLYLEGDQFHRYRLLRCVKNRFGATSEVGVFEMVERGMKEVKNPSEAFLAERQVNAPGSSIAVTIEGTRPLLVEVQALVNSTTFSNPRRTANGIDYNRLLLLSAVLSRRANIRLQDKDIYVNVVGGLKVAEPAIDLALAVAIASSSLDRATHADMVFVGEVGLSGELRTVGQLDARLGEAAKLGFKRCIIPQTARSSTLSFPNTLEVIGSRTLRDVLAKGLVAN
jgi:DNA repair protein RadA/Sms